MYTEGRNKPETASISLVNAESKQDSERERGTQFQGSEIVSKEDTDKEFDTNSKQNTDKQPETDFEEDIGKQTKTDFESGVDKISNTGSDEGIKEDLEKPVLDSKEDTTKNPKIKLKDNSEKDSQSESKVDASNKPEADSEKHADKESETDSKPNADRKPEGDSEVDTDKESEIATEQGADKKLTYEFHDESKKETVVDSNINTVTNLETDSKEDTNTLENKFEDDVQNKPETDSLEDIYKKPVIDSRDNSNRKQDKLKTVSTEDNNENSETELTDNSETESREEARHESETNSEEDTDKRTETTSKLDTDKAIDFEADNDKRSKTSPEKESVKEPNEIDDDPRKELKIALKVGTVIVPETDYHPVKEPKANNQEDTDIKLQVESKDDSQKEPQTDSKLDIDKEGESDSERDANKGKESKFKGDAQSEPETESMIIIDKESGTIPEEDSNKELEKPKHYFEENTNENPNTELKEKSEKHPKAESRTDASHAAENNSEVHIDKRTETDSKPNIDKATNPEEDHDKESETASEDYSDKNRKYGHDGDLQSKSKFDLEVDTLKNPETDSQIYSDKESETNSQEATDKEAPVDSTVAFQKELETDSKLSSDIEPETNSKPSADKATGFEANNNKESETPSEDYAGKEPISEDDINDPQTQTEIDSKVDAFKDSETGTKLGIYIESDDKNTPNESKEDTEEEPEMDSMPDPDKGLATGSEKDAAKEPRSQFDDDSQGELQESNSKNESESNFKETTVKEEIDSKDNAQEGSKTDHKIYTDDKVEADLADFKEDDETRQETVSKKEAETSLEIDPHKATEVVSKTDDDIRSETDYEKDADKHANEVSGVDHSDILDVRKEQATPSEDIELVDESSEDNGELVENDLISNRTIVRSGDEEVYKNGKKSEFLSNSLTGSIEETNDNTTPNTDVKMHEESGDDITDTEASLQHTASSSANEYSHDHDAAGFVGDSTFESKVDSEKESNVDNVPCPDNDTPSGSKDELPIHHNSQLLPDFKMKSKFTDKFPKDFYGDITLQSAVNSSLEFRNDLAKDSDISSTSVSIDNIPLSSDADTEPHLVDRNVPSLEDGHESVIKDDLPEAPADDTARGSDNDGTLTSGYDNVLDNNNAAHFDVDKLSESKETREKDYENAPTFFKKDLVIDSEYDHSTLKSESNLYKDSNVDVLSESNDNKEPNSNVRSAQVSKNDILIDLDVGTAAHDSALEIKDVLPKDSDDHSLSGSHNDNVANSGAERPSVSVNDIQKDSDNEHSLDFDAENISNSNDISALKLKEDLLYSGNNAPDFEGDSTSDLKDNFVKNNEDESASISEDNLLNQHDDNAPACEDENLLNLYVNNSKNLEDESLPYSDIDGATVFKDIFAKKSEDNSASESEDIPPKKFVDNKSLTFKEKLARESSSSALHSEGEKDSYRDKKINSKDVGTLESKNGVVKDVKDSLNSDDNSLSEYTNKLESGSNLDYTPNSEGGGASEFKSKLQKGSEDENAPDSDFDRVLHSYSESASESKENLRKDVVNKNLPYSENDYSSDFKEDLPELSTDYTSPSYIGVIDSESKDDVSEELAEEISPGSKLNRASKSIKNLRQSKDGFVKSTDDDNIHDFVIHGASESKNEVSHFSDEEESIDSCDNNRLDSDINDPSESKYDLSNNSENTPDSDEDDVPNFSEDENLEDSNIDGASNTKKEPQQYSHNDTDPHSVDSSPLNLKDDSTSKSIEDPNNSFDALISADNDGAFGLKNGKDTSSLDSKALTTPKLKAPYNDNAPNSEDESVSNSKNGILKGAAGENLLNSGDDSTPEIRDYHVEDSYRDNPPNSESNGSSEYENGLRRDFAKSTAPGSNTGNSPNTNDNSVSNSRDGFAKVIDKSALNSDAKYFNDNSASSLEEDSVSNSDDLSKNSHDENVITDKESNSFAKRFDNENAPAFDDKSSLLSVNGNAPSSDDDDDTFESIDVLTKDSIGISKVALNSHIDSTSELKDGLLKSSYSPSAFNDALAKDFNPYVPTSDINVASESEDVHAHSVGDNTANCYANTTLVSKDKLANYFHNVPWTKDSNHALTADSYDDRVLDSTESPSKNLGGDDRPSKSKDDLTKGFNDDKNSNCDSTPDFLDDNESESADKNPAKFKDSYGDITSVSSDIVGYDSNSYNALNSNDDGGKASKVDLLKYFKPDKLQESVLDSSSESKQVVTTNSPDKTSEIVDYSIILKSKSIAKSSALYPEEVFALKSDHESSFTYSDEKINKAAEQKVEVLEKELEAKIVDEVDIADNAYKDALQLRTMLTSIVSELKSLKNQSDDSSTKLANREAKELKQRLSDLEDYLRDWKLKEAALKADNGKQEHTENRIQILESELERRDVIEQKLHQARGDVETLKDQIQKLGSMIESQKPDMYYEDLAKTLQSEVEERKRMDDITLHATEKEAYVMKNKLKDLETQLQDLEHDNKGFESLKVEAEDLRSRLKLLEKEVEEKKKHEENIKILSEQKEEKLMERISSLETELQRRKEKEEVIYAAQHEAVSLKETFKNLDEEVKSIITTRDSAMRERFLTLEGQLKERRSTESEMLSKNQAETNKLLFKLSALEDLLKDKDDHNTDNNIAEVQHLKQQIQSLEDQLKSRFSSDENLTESSMKREELLQQRIDSLEEELQKMTIKEEETLKSVQATQAVFDRVRALEVQLSAEEQAKTTKVSKEDILLALKEVAMQESRDGDDSLKEVWNVMLSKQKCKVDENAHKNIEETESQNLIEEESTQDKECVIALEKRIQCGTDITPEELCKSLRCCWSAHPKPDIPNCYYTATQMRASEEIMLEQVSQGSGENEEKTTDKPTILPSGDPYDQLHEGKIVSWDESFEKKEEKKSSWDEELGKENENNATTAEISTEENNANQRPETMTTSNDASETNKENHYEKPTPEPPILVETTLMPSSEESHVHTAETPTTKPKVPEQIDYFITTAPVQLTGGQYKGSRIAMQDDTETQPRLTDDDLPWLTDDDDSHAESTILTLLSLLCQLPSDIVYAFTPLGLWWLSLLPEEYQEDVFGVSWPIILLTFVLGFVLIWVIIWRSSVTKRIDKERRLYMHSEELRGQLEVLMSEKLDTENNLKDSQTKFDEINNNFEEAQTAQSKAQDELNQLKNVLGSLREENDKKVHEIDQINTRLKEATKERTDILNKSKQTQKSLEERKSAFVECEKHLAQVQKELKESQKQNKKLEDKAKDIQKRLDKKQKSENENDWRLKEWEDRAEDMKKQIKMLEDKISAMTDDNTTKTQEADVLKDCLLQFRGIQEALTDDGDDDLENDELLEKQKEKLKDLIDVARIQKKVKHTEMEKGRIIIELEAEKKSREETESRVGELEAECENIRAMQQKSERELQVQQAKLNVMQEFYAKREVEMQGKLGKEQTVREINESKLAEEGDRTSQLLEQLEVYKKMNEDAKREFDESEKQRKNEINQYEKKAHSSWLASREAERKLDETNREMAQLRLEINELERRCREAETREPFLVRPRPLPPGGMFPGPRMGSGRGSPLPMRNGPPFRDMSPPPGRFHGRRSPTGSLQEDSRRPDRPPSLSYSEHRPPSHGPPVEPLELGDGHPRAFGMRRDTPRRDDPHFHEEPVRDGPPPRNESLTPRSGAPPFAGDEVQGMRGGLPQSLRVLPPPIRDGPPLRIFPPSSRRGPSPMMRNNIPPVIHGGPPQSLREGPPFGPPPPMMYNTPPTRDGLPPRMPRSGSSQGPLTSSPYMEHPMQPPRDPSNRPPMSLHGNLPPDASYN